MQSQQHAQQDFIARAKMLAHVMTSSSNIQVTISGDTAFCSFGHINLPAGDYTDPTFRKMVQGWIDHELGHEDESDPNHARQANREPVLQHIFGRIEDVRMERSRGRKFRGAKTNLATLAELAIDRGLFLLPESEHDIGTLIINHILYRGRSVVIGQQCLDTFAAEGHRLIVEKTSAQFADGLNQLIDKAETLSSSQDSLDLSREIFAYIQQEDEDQQNQSADTPDDNDHDHDNTGDSDDQPTGQDDSNDSETSDSPANDTSPDSDTQDTQDIDSSGTSEPSDSQQDDANSSSSSDTQDSDPSDVDNLNSQPDSSSASDPQPLQIVQSMQDCDAKDFHEAIAEMISEDCAQQPDHASDSPEFDFVEGSSHYDFDSSALDVSLARRLSANVFQALHKVLIDIQPELPVTRKRGKRINSRLFSGIPAGNMKVFHSRVEQEVREAAVTLVIDASPSMNIDDRLKHANTCALAFAFALQRLNIPFEVVYFGSHSGDRFQMYRPKTFEQTLQTNSFEVLCGNYSTPTGEAMQFALSSLALRNENNKLMLLLTDGHPDSDRRVQQSHSLAKGFGVNVVPFALCTDYVRGFDKHEFVSVSEPSGLTPALRQATKQKLFA